MKGKNKIQMIIMILSFLMMNQFTNAESYISPACKCNKPYFGCNPNDGACLEACTFKCTFSGGSVTIGNPDALPETGINIVYPDPVSQVTTISFSLSEAEKISLKIFDMTGRLVATLVDETLEAGENKINWDSGKINSGIYFLKMEVGKYSVMERISKI